MSVLEPRLPTFLWLEPQLRRIEAAGGAYYVRHRGTPHSAGVLVILMNKDQTVKVYQQQRNAADELGWVRVFGREAVEESKADAYSARAMTRDPDLWVIEIETRSDDFPLDGPVFDDFD